MGATVTLLMALTADGKIARDPEHAPDWSGKTDKQLFVRLTRKAGVLIMGRKTYDTIGRPLPGRLNVVMTRNRRLRSAYDNLLYTDRSPRALVEWLSGQGYSEVILAGGATINNLFAREQLIDQMVLTISPLIFGEGLSLFSQTFDMRLKLLKTEALGTDQITLYYRVIKQAHRI